jgi:hypothetical protein
VTLESAVDGDGVAVDEVPSDGGSDCDPRRSGNV